MTVNTAWMWKDDQDAIWGLTLNRERGVLEFADSIGCACGDSFAEQTFADFRARGSRYADLPADVEAEVLAALAALGF
jgi:3-hydroxyacyl-CoA dehydrogenase